MRSVVALNERCVASYTSIACDKRLTAKRTMNTNREPHDYRCLFSQMHTAQRCRVRFVESECSRHVCKFEYRNVRPTHKPNTLACHAPESMHVMSSHLGWPLVLQKFDARIEGPITDLRPYTHTHASRKYNGTAPRSRECDYLLTFLRKHALSLQCIVCFPSPLAPLITMTNCTWTFGSASTSTQKKGIK